MNKQKMSIIDDYRVSNAISLINRELEFYFNHHTKTKDSLNISRMEGVYLMLLKDNPAITQVEIGDILKADAALVSKFTKSLLDKGYVCREADKYDKRKKSLYLTDEAHKILPKFLSSYREFNTLVFNGFSEQEYENFAVYLNKFFRNTQDFKTRKTP